MARENEKLMKKKRVEEERRIRRLVEMAAKRDFRLLREKQREKDERERRQREAQEAKERAAREERERKEREEAERRRAAEEAVRAEQARLAFRRDRTAAINAAVRGDGRGDEWHLVKDIVVRAMDDAELERVAGLAPQALTLHVEEAVAAYIARRDKAAQNEPQCDGCAVPL